MRRFLHGFQDLVDFGEAEGELRVSEGGVICRLCWEVWPTR